MDFCLEFTALVINIFRVHSDIKRRFCFKKLSFRNIKFKINDSGFIMKKKKKDISVKWTFNGLLEGVTA